MDAVAKSDESAIPLDAVPSPVIDVICAEVGLVVTVSVFDASMVRMFDALMTKGEDAEVLEETVVFVVKGFAIASATTCDPTKILP